jgi:Spermine/spermidine synthase domain
MVTVARAESERGELLLRRREADGALELRVNGVLVMDTSEASSERLLGTAALELLAGSDPGTDSPAGSPTARRSRSSSDGVRRLAVLVGGLGLGYTLREVLREPAVSRVVVAEIEPVLVEWHRRGLIPHAPAPLADSRVLVDARDVRTVVEEQAADSLDLILLDVDNGPDYLVYADNARLYRPAFLSRCRESLAPDGVIAVWSSNPAPELAEALGEVFAACQHIVVPVTLGSRHASYHILLGRRVGGCSPRTAPGGTAGG